MSIIIRLQNLPWDASAINIRQFFHGLSIPSGGVHIVGGDKGDAFIAFSTDEDARLAMGKNMEMIGNSTIKLFLSSKTEMQNIINQARKTTEETALIPTNPPFQGSNQYSNVDHFKNQQFNRPEQQNMTGQSLYQKRPENNYNNNLYDNRPDIQAGQSRNQQAPRSGYTSLDNNINSYKNYDPFSNQAPKVDYNSAISPIGGKFQNNNNQMYTNNSGQNQNRNNFPSMNEINQMSQDTPMIRSGGFQNQSWQMGLNSQNQYNQGNNDMQMQQRFSDRPTRPLLTLDNNRLNKFTDDNFRKAAFINTNNDSRFQISNFQKFLNDPLESQPSLDYNKMNIDDQPNKLQEKDQLYDTKNFPNVKTSRFDNKPTEGYGLKRPASSDDNCIVITGLPITFNYREIRILLSGCEIDIDGIKIINNEFGIRTGRAYVRFKTRRSFELGLRKDKTIIDSCKIDIQECSENEFIKAIDSLQPVLSRSPKGKADSDYYVIVKRLPINYTISDIRKLLGNVRFAKNGGPHIERTRAGKSMGNALMELDRKRDFLDVLSMHKERVKGNSILVIAISKTEYEMRIKSADTYVENGDNLDIDMKRDRVMSRDRDNRDKNMNINFRDKVTDKDHRDKASERTCVHIRGLPYDANIQSIKDFFRGIPIIENGIHMLVDSSNKLNGTAFVEFATEEDCERARKKDKDYMGKRYLEIMGVNRHDMINELQQNRKFVKGNIERQEESYVYMRNLSEKTQLDDIMTFFRGYRPILDSIKLQYKDDKPTGDGLVAFGSRKEAEEVVRSCYKKLLLGRLIDLELWDL